MAGKRNQSVLIIREPLYFIGKDKIETRRKTIFFEVIG